MARKSGSAALPALEANLTLHRAREGAAVQCTASPFAATSLGAAILRLDNNHDATVVVNLSDKKSI